MPKIKAYLAFLFILRIIRSSPMCVEGENLYIKCNPLSKLCYKCENNIYIPDKNGGCKYAKKIFNKRKSMFGI